MKVGTIESLDVTPDNKAAIVLRIDDPAFQDFKQDAHCTIRLQSLIGEKFVACHPTLPKGADAEPAPPLHQIQHGDGEGRVPAAGRRTPPRRSTSTCSATSCGCRSASASRSSSTSSASGLAGNGQQLQRRDPPRGPGALPVRQSAGDPRRGRTECSPTSATESDAALAPVAAQSQSISDFIDKAGATAAATAARGDALEQSFAKLPGVPAAARPDRRAARRVRRGRHARDDRPAHGGAVYQHDLRAARPVQPGGAADLPHARQPRRHRQSRAARRRAGHQRHPRVRAGGEAVRGRAGARR